MEQELLILAYHRVGRPDPGARYKGQFVTPAQLAFQVKGLQHLNYQVLTLTDALGAPGKRAVITFDDGYRNNLVLGLPVLSSIGVPATVFAVTTDVGRSGVVWEEAGETNPSDLMNWDELKQLQAHGWEIGSHCSKHVHLAIKSDDEQVKLIKDSMDELIKHLGPSSYPFAYPYGSFTSRTSDIVKNAGFSCAVSMLAGSQSTGDKRYSLRRMPMKGYRADHYLRAPIWWATRILE